MKRLPKCEVCHIKLMRNRKGDLWCKECERTVKICDVCGLQYHACTRHQYTFSNIPSENRCHGADSIRFAYQIS